MLGLKVEGRRTSCNRFGKRARHPDDGAVSGVFGEAYPRCFILPVDEVSRRRRAEMVLLVYVVVNDITVSQANGGRPSVIVPVKGLLTGP
jgi:hypothetical protein